ncbi:MAG: bifunctional metallophosphatase/5'-nucleotidase [Clostridiales bacterium]|nr:bifunctional metallophosphatase/5'-nucleotidase [Clostridiales bacterium]
MKKFLGLILALAMLLGCVAYAEDADVPALTKDVVVLFTSDVHCGIDQGWGYAGLSAVRDALAKKNHVVLVDNGDSIQGEAVGTLTRGEALIELMNAVGYDIAIPGNHEFDYGMDRFLELTGKADFPYISSNFNKEGELVFKPYVIKEFDGVKIAFVGISTPKTLTSSTPAYFMDDAGNFIYDFMQDETGEKLYNAVQTAVDAAIAEGAAYVVAMGHTGNEAECQPWTYADIIGNTNGIDAYLDGHSHDKQQLIMKNKDGEDVLRSACGTKMENIGYLRISAADGSMTCGLYKWNYDFAGPEVIRNDITDAVEAATATLNEKLQEVVARTAVDLYVYDPVATDVRLIRTVETNIGDLVADAYRDQSGADIAVVNGGGIRVNIPAGDITYDQLLKLHPYGNYLCVVEVTGQQVLEALEYAVKDVPGEFGGFLQVSGLTFEIHTYIPSSVKMDVNKMYVSVDGEYRVKNVMVGGEPLDLEKTYTLASHDYKLKGNGDGNTVFDDCKILQDEVKIDNQVVIDYIVGTLGGEVGEAYADPYGQGRIVAVSEAPAAE